MNYAKKMLTAAGAVSAAVAPAMAEGAVVWTSQSLSLKFSDVTVGVDAFVPWDVDGDSTPDFFLAGTLTSSTSTFGSGGTVSTSGGIGLVNPDKFNTGGTSPNAVFAQGGPYGGGFLRLSASMQVGPTLASGVPLASRAPAVFGGAYSYSTTGGFTSFSSGAYVVPGMQPGPNLIGFQFDIGGSNHFGFAQLVVTDGPTYPDAGIAITRWAYETDADTPIHVTPIPGSGVAALTLLGLGAAGLRRQRRRKMLPEAA